MYFCIKISMGTMKLASCKSALNTPYPRWFVLLPVLRRWSRCVILFVALWFILRGDLLTMCYLFLCFSVLLALWLPRLGKRGLILVLFIHLFDLRLFAFVCFFFLLVSGKGCGLWLRHSLNFNFSLSFFSGLKLQIYLWNKVCEMWFICLT